MSSEAIDRERPLAILAVVIFPLFGPLLFGLGPSLLLAVLGLLTLGVASIPYSAMYFLWWLPSLYLTLAPPFLATGLLYALGRRLRSLPALGVLALAALVAFPGTIGTWYWATGSLEIPGSTSPGIWSDPAGVAIFAAPALLLCWWPIRRFR